MQITIQGYQFEVPDSAIAYAVGYVIQTEGEAHIMRQTKVENLRNAFARRVKIAEKEYGGELSLDAIGRLQAEFNEYAVHYKFGERSVAIRRDPIEREMRKIVTEDLSAAYFAKYAEKADKADMESAVDRLLADNEKHAHYKERAKEVIRLRESMGLEDLARVGL